MSIANGDKVKLNIIDVANLVKGVSIVDGIGYMVSGKVKPYGNGNKMFTGEIRNVDAVISLKCFDNIVVDYLDKVNLEGKVVIMDGTVEEYKGVEEIHIRSIKEKEGVNRTLFMKKVDNINALFTEFKTFLNTELSDEYYKVAQIILQKRLARYIEEFSGKKMHDALIGGLLNHVMKMLRIAKTVVGNDSRIDPYKDIIYLGIVLHDIGKIEEMQLGVYTENSFVTHRTIGIEMLTMHKNEIIDAIGSVNYYHMLAIIQGHHGQYGDAPTTVWAYIVHLVDMLDAHVTGTLDKIDRGEIEKGNCGRDGIRMNGGVLIL